MIGNRRLLTDKQKVVLAAGSSILFLLSFVLLNVFADPALSSQMPVTEPDLTVTALRAPDAAVTGEPFKASMTVSNQGGGPAGTNSWVGYQWHDAFYLSDDEQWDANDKEVAGAWNGLYLRPGENYTVQMDVTVPADRPAGTYYLLAVTDDGRTINEFNEANNVMVKKIVVSGRCQADKPALGLTGVRNVYWASYADYLARELTVDFLITNAGPGMAYGAAVGNVSSNNGVQSSAPVPISLGQIAPGKSAAASVKYNVPPGVSRFLSVLTGTAADACGAAYSFSN